MARVSRRRTSPRFSGTVFSCATDLSLTARCWTAAWRDRASLRFPMVSNMSVDSKTGCFTVRGSSGFRTEASTEASGKTAAKWKVCAHFMKHCGISVQIFVQGTGRCCARGVLRIAAGAYTFADGLAYQEEEWDYITPKDRRFQTERLRDKVWPSGDCQRRNETEDDDVPEGCYDVGAGMYFDPSDDTIRKNETRDVVRTPSDEEREWVLTKCRQKHPPTGAEAAIALRESATMSTVGGT